MSKRKISEVESSMVTYGGSSSNSDATEISEIVDEKVFVGGIGGGGELCVFEPSTLAKRAARNKSSWFDSFNYNLNKGNSTVVYCDTPQNNLSSLFMYCKNHLNLDEYYDKLYPEPMSNVCIEKAVAPRIVNQVGISVQGGLQQFYFYDRVTLKLCTGKHGPFLKLYWSKMAIHNRLMANFISLYRGWDKEDIVKMQTDILINVPTKEKQKKAFVSKFFDIFGRRNKNIFENGINHADGPLVCDMFTIERFDSVFEFNYEENNQVKPSDGVEMTMYAVLEGFKVGKEKELNTVYNKTISVKPYSVAVQPLCFFHPVEEED
ncbi:DBP-1 [Artaxa digramma nucleopolyhedrovirus]|uniref:DBP-1 n=1 Tax=Artaxa digramma nucleopolyhedrovirus TaxID=3070910 RepID=A0AAE6R6W6_9ABAC|nr:DBP-1 [Euproctis digramma nucleopolyhedrovirus]QHB21704.1 DBP-1 [Artaxa digramma nucleopolyhedrovirus]